MSRQVGSYKLYNSLGKGAFGEVFLTQKVGKSGFFATKKLNREYSEKEENIKRLYNEINLLKIVHHQNVVGLVDLMQTNKNIYIVTEYCNGGDLNKCLKKYIEINKRPFPEELVQYIMKQIISGLDFLHSRKIIHRDLKLDNILICFNSDKDKSSLNLLNSTAKITDFGFSKIIGDMTDTIIGTPIYMPPGMIYAMTNKTKNQAYDFKADIWSLGILCYEMLVGKCPFVGNNMLDLYNKIQKGDYELPNYLSQEVSLFITSMLAKDDNIRFSCKELLKHDFLNKNYKEFKKLDATQIPGFVAQKSAFIIINSGITQTNIQNANNIKDVVNPVKPMVKKAEQAIQNTNNNINNKNINNQNQKKVEQKQNPPQGNQKGAKPGYGQYKSINPYKSTPIFHNFGSI